MRYIPELILKWFKKQILLFHLACLDNGRNPDIATIKIGRVDIFSEYCAENLKENNLHYVTELLFETGKIDLKGTYLEGTTPTALQN